MAAGAYHNLIVKDCGAVLSWGCGVFTSTGKSNDGCVPALGLFKSFNNNNNNNNNKNAEEVITPFSQQHTLSSNIKKMAIDDADKRIAREIISMVHSKKHA